MRAGGDEDRSPKYAHIERERRFLVDRASRPDMAGLPFVLIDDRCLEGTRIRLRWMRDSTTGQTVFKLTKKYESADPLARPIVTAYLAEAEYEAFLMLPARTLVKRRYKVSGTGFGIDLFEGALDGLELTEIELPDDTSLRAMAPPAWAKLEVSQDFRFEGGHLARLGPGEVAALLVDPRL